MFGIKFLKIFILITLTCLLQNANGNPIERNDSELKDLNVQRNLETEPSNYSNYKDNNEEQNQSGFLESEKKFKNDVEILEADLQSESGLEEQFRGSGLERDTDTFTDENIEVTSIVKETDKTNNFIIATILIVFALLSIGLYIGLILWRSHLEQRYGMRELLVDNENELS